MGAPEFITVGRIVVEEVAAGLGQLLGSRP
jgi:hypothetical protein